MSFRRALNAVGRVLLGAGILLLLFTAYQLWGTGLVEAHSQAGLRTTLNNQLHKVATSRQLHSAPRLTGPSRLGSANVVAPAEPAPAEGQPVGSIDIPKIGIDQVVVQGIGTDDLRMGPGHYPGTPLPGELGNSAIAGHRTTYGHPFYNLNELSPGDPVLLTTPQGVFAFTVSRTMVVSPDDNSVLRQSDFAELTLTTCNPRFSASQRLVVQARLSRSLLFGGGHAPAPRTPHPASPSADGLAGTSGGWLAPVLWGLAVAGAGVVLWLIARRVRRHWLAYLAGTPVVLVLLFFFFGALRPLLPASFRADGARNPRRRPARRAIPAVRPNGGTRRGPAVRLHLRRGRRRPRPAGPDGNRPPGPTPSQPLVGRRPLHPPR